MADQLVKKVFRDEFGVLFVGKFLLGHKCIGVEPFQKIGSIGSHDLRLRIMDMRVDEARHNEVRAVIGEFHIRARFTADLGIVAKAQDTAVFDQNRTVFDIAIGMAVIEALRLVTKSQHTAADEKLCHSVLVPSFGPVVTD
ncbi:hypothetical protein B989_00639 [Brucella sp. 56/94]|nr:hypothetical protein B989_00639 [Brucella sp. 56/94]